MGFFQKLLNPKVLNPILSIFDREARKVVAGIAAKIPEDSFLRSEIFGRAFDVFRGAIEGADFGKFSTVVEKLTDYGDALAEDLTDENVKKGSGGLQSWINKFFVEASKRLASATNPAEELEKIKVEFTARMQLLRLIEAEAEKYAEEKKASQKKPDSKPLEVGKKVREFSRQALLVLGKTAEKVNEAADKVAEPLESLNEGLSKRAGARPLKWECRWFKEPTEKREEEL